jgi:transcriptional regulator with XRE-family HTH domain
MLLLSDGARIKALRLGQGMSQRRLCALAKISCKTLRRMENSNHVQRKSVRAVASVLGCDPRELAIPKGRLLALRVA